MRYISVLGLVVLTVATVAFAQAGPGKGYKQIASGAYSVVAEVHARPGKEAELRRTAKPRTLCVLRGVRESARLRERTTT